MILSLRTTASKLVAFLVATRVLGYDDQQRKNDKILPSVILPRLSTHRGSMTNFTYWVTTTSSSQSTKAYLVVTNQEWSVVVPPPMSSSLETMGDGTSTWTAHKRRKPTTPNHHQPLRTTAYQAKQNHCDVVATNGGPFNKDGTSSGPLVVQGQLESNHTVESSYVGIGITMPQLMNRFAHDLEPKPQYWVMGTYSQVMEELQQTQQSQQLAMQVPSILWNFVTGFQWLVHNGTAVADNSKNPTGAPQAARTVMGLDRDLNFFVLVTDGCERWYVSWWLCGWVWVIFCFLSVVWVVGSLVSLRSREGESNHQVMVFFES
jgi:hypothetical protein